jgi:hypothetical protein
MQDLLDLMGDGPIGGSPSSGNPGEDIMSGLGAMNLSGGFGSGYLSGGKTSVTFPKEVILTSDQGQGLEIKGTFSRK